MKKIEIFDPAMCCSTGVCGPAIDPELLRIATAVSMLNDKGIHIIRHGLATEPQEFVSHTLIHDLIQQKGTEILPITLIDGEVVKTGTYPTNEELSEWLGIKIANKKAESTGGCSCGCCCGGKENC